MSGQTYIANHLIKKVYIGGIKIRKIFVGDKNVFSSGYPVTYHIDTGNDIIIDVDDNADCITNAPTVSVPGWELHGWREDTTASATVLESKTCDQEGIELYAVLKKTITASYDGNGATSGSVADTTGTMYHNNGNDLGASIKLASNGYTKTNYQFSKWAEGSASGTQYAAGTTRILTADTVYYAAWVKAPTTYTFNNRVGAGYPNPDYNGYCMGINCTGYAYADIDCQGYMGGMYNNTSGGVTNAVYVGVADNNHLCQVAGTFCGAGGSGEGYGEFTDTHQRRSRRGVRTVNISNLNGTQYICGRAEHDGWGGGLVSAGVDVYTVTLHN